MIFKTSFQVHSTLKFSFMIDHLERAKRYFLKIFGICLWSGKGAIFVWWLYFRIQMSLWILDLMQYWFCTETLLETTESGPLCITDLFQNKCAAYFQFFYEFFNIFLNFILCNFSVRTLGTRVFLKENQNYFFNLKKLKKLPQKVAYLWQLGFFFLCSPDCPKQPRTSFTFYKFFYSIISGRISDFASKNILHAKV